MEPFEFSGWRVYRLFTPMKADHDEPGDDE